MLDDGDNLAAVDKREREEELNKWKRENAVRLNNTQGAENSA